MYAELAVLEHLGLPELFEDDVSVAGDGGYGDITLPSTATIQVKFNGIDERFALRDSSPSAFNDDFGWLVIPVDRNDDYLDNGVILRGWFRQDVAQRFGLWTSHDYGYGVRAVIEPHNLWRPEVFIEDGYHEGISSR